MISMASHDMVCLDFHWQGDIEYAKKIIRIYTG